MSVNLKWHSTFYGPNRFVREPVVVASLSVTQDLNVTEVRAAAKYLFQQIPLKHDWATEYESGPQDDPEVLFAHLAARWALVLLTDVRGFFESAGAKRSEDSVQMWVGFHVASFSRSVIQWSLNCFLDVLSGRLDEAAFQTKLDDLSLAARKLHPDYQAGIIMTAAVKRHIPYASAWGMPAHWRFGEGEKSVVLFESSSTEDGAFGSRISASKTATKRILAQLGLPTPRFELVQNGSDLPAIIAKVGFPCVTKPIDRGGGRGVSAGLTTPDAVASGVREARTFSKAPILVEAHLPGEDHRLMVIDGVFSAAIRREPSNIVGDGSQTIRQLAEQINSKRDNQRKVRSKYHAPIEFDQSSLLHLKGLQLTPDSILSKGQSVRVRSNANLATGGVCIDVTDQVHQQIRVMAETIARTLNIRMLGADYLTTDISKSPEEELGGFIEVNLTPGLSAMIAAGWDAEVTGALCLPSELGVIPKVLIVVSEQDFATYSKVLKASEIPAGLGWATKDLASLSQASLVVPQSEGWAGLQTLLQHRLLQAAMVVITPYQIQTFGVPASHFTKTVFVGAALPEVEQLCASVSQTVERLPPVVSPKEVVTAAIDRLLSAKSAESA
jgi:D-alanine-D-alanine ligase-like ATP-grasp enzyme